MELIENPYIADQIIEQLELEYKLIKPLPHLTELVYCLTRSYYDRTDPLPPTKREVLLFALGWGLERLLLKEQRKIETGICENINFSPDFLSISEIPGELKTTRISSGKFSAGTFPGTWLKQILGYMYCLEKDEYELAVLFICGNYKPPFPELNCYRLSATYEEIYENWKWLQMRYGIYMNCINKHQRPVPKMFCEPWECDNCRFIIRCEANETANTIPAIRAEHDDC